MLNRVKGIVADESGQVLPMFVLLLVVLLGVSAIVIDGGRIYHLSNEAHNIAEASALSTVDYLKDGSSDDRVKSVAMEYAIDNGAKNEEVSIVTSYGGIDESGNLLSKISVRVSKEHNMTFGKIINKNDRMVTGQYTVEVTPDGD